MKKLTLAAATAALLFTPLAVVAQTTPALILVVDTDRVFQTCTACVAATTQLQGQFAALQQRRTTLSTPLQTEMQSIQQAATAARAMAPGAARTAAETAIQGRLQALQQREEAANQELGRSEQTVRSTQQHVAQQVSERLGPIVRQVMTARGANIVIPKGATLDAADALDVTNDVLVALNQQLPSVSVTPMPQQPGAAAPAATTPATTPPRPRPQGR